MELAELVRQRVAGDVPGGDLWNSSKRVSRMASWMIEQCPGATEHLDGARQQNRATGEFLLHSVESSHRVANWMLSWICCRSTESSHVDKGEAVQRRRGPRRAGRTGRRPAGRGAWERCRRRRCSVSALVGPAPGPGARWDWQRLFQLGGQWLGEGHTRMYSSWRPSRPSMSSGPGTTREATAVDLLGKPPPLLPVKGAVLDPAVRAR